MAVSTRHGTLPAVKGPALLFILILALGSKGFAATCVEPPPPDARFELGLALQNLMPSRLPSFSGALPAYGIVASFPWGANAIEAQVIYGVSDGVAAKLFEVGYRYNVRITYLTGFALVGAHVLNYSTPGPDQTYPGGFLGLGAVIPMAGTFAIDIFVKSYFQIRPMFAVGGAFRVAL